ncbi:sugar porter family MFS transporter [Gorillibacterium timonense]|uniref:sugar porter family MFS transporter n=1 Tax=Gorillibacterium timonense TaxID=1689269 RepID=UPI00071CA043|nr:sugar porter family MFS transporter [Gorillibacterium timonense]
MSTSTIPTDSGPRMKFVFLVTAVAALGGFLAGFDTAAMSGANAFLRERFALSDFMLGWTVSCLIIGCAIGAAFAGALGDRLGRKKVLIGASLLFIAGIAVSALSPSLPLLIVFRMIEGLGLGLTSALCPLYNAEIAPAKYRGRLVAMNQLALVTGIFLGSLLAYGITGLGDELWNQATGWRILLGIGVVPGVLFLLLLFLVPESPRWLIKQGKPEKALPILLKIHGEELARKEVLDIKQSFKQEEGLGHATLKELFASKHRIILVVGVMMAVLQQVTGINAIMYYAPTIFRQAGAGTSGSLTQAIFVGLVNLLFTILSLWLVDKAGRKLLILIGSAFMTVSLTVIGYAFYSGNTSGPLVLAAILVYVAAFAVSLGAVVWVILAEIFPNRIRGLATAVCTMALWAMDFVVSQSFPSLISTAGPAVTFWMFAATSLFTFLFTLGVVPETKGKSLEEIEAMWETHRQDKENKDRLKTSLQKS